MLSLSYSVDVRTNVKKFLSAFIRMVQLIVSRREPALVWPDRLTGGWIHKYVAGTLVSPQPRGLPWSIAKEKTIDLSLYRYKPKAGDTVLEFGAEFGTETVTLSELVGPNGRVVAVEAHPWTCKLLERTVELNGLGNVTVLNVAVADEAGVVMISDDGASGTLSNSIVTASPDGVAVEGITVDKIVTRLGIERIDFLKMNIEGAEAQAIKGMNQSVELVQSIMISCHDFRADAGDGDVFRTLAVVEAAMREWGFVVESRPEDPRPWVRGYLYGTRAA